MRAAVKAVVLGFVAVTLLTGCGGSPTPPAPAAGGAKGPPPKKLIKDEATVEAEEVYVNPRWALLEEHFGRFTRRPASTHKDMFKSRLDKYVEKIEIKEAVPTDEDEDAEVTKGKEEEIDPLKKFPADEYKVVAIMTGVGIPSALLKDPKGNSYPIRVDSEVGNEEGVVESITQYEVVIRNPREPKPVRLNIKPRMFEVSMQQAEDRAKEEEVPDELEEPD